MRAECEEEWRRSSERKRTRKGINKGEEGESQN
jgi:hypothetical protein